MEMNLQNIFYLTATLFFLTILGVSIYIFIVFRKLQEKIEKTSENVQRTVKDLSVVKYALKAGILKTFISLINRRGGDKEYE